MNAPLTRFLGIDLGTGSLKVALVDEAGVERAVASVAYTLDTPQPGWAEIDVERWWRALVDACARLPEDERAAVKGIGFSGQMHGVVLTDAAGRALRPAMLWPDTRAHALLDGWQLGAGQSDGAASNPVAPGMAGPLLRWVMQNEHAIADAAQWALQPKDWLRLRLAGAAQDACVADPSDACATALAAPDGAWDFALIERLGLPARWFAPLAASGAASGTLHADAARALGVPAGVVLATGAGDTPCAALGSGLHEDGDALLTTGTGGQILVTARTAPPARRGLHRYRSASGGWYAMAAMQNVGVALEAARGWLAYDWAQAYEEAFAAPPSPTLTFLPYLSGERSPWLDPAARGGWLGAGIGDTRGMLMRAAFEGVAFALRAGLDALREANAGEHGTSDAAIATLKLAGGGSVDPRWRQLLADTLGARLDAIDCPNAATRGAALLGGVACGHWRIDELAALAPAATRVAQAREDAALAQRYARFIDLYGRVRTWFPAA
ncbi:sugar (pentulose or hexulose) kinase [Paraburkholderia bannensis]|uniref:Sugar (Pentulose or hexulose) kinase n=1 Tax=Paraburkholderia bannensis TaxID=765414 RepID=A0A7W9TSI3_9BURK|nr:MULTISPECIES: FGGY family carbohydrate kinase [Paraburkholderia]MBB3255321.1 sugar (pentulose or hexulose) kinase [Paraburkholderia sp. WP4_3_2]MBB6100667.1 sugar (pentulose or hexulose) kinase [Paraburkholderia bannensis]